ncbi:MAG: HEAT repeat domain-containing protein [Phycisphaerales bacterium]
MPDSLLKVAMSLPDEPVYPGGPAPLDLTVTNASTQAVRVELPFPNPLGIAVASANPAVAVPRPAPEQVVQRTIPKTLAPGQSITQRHDLNRFLAIKSAGKAPLTISVSIPVHRTPKDSAPADEAPTAPSPPPPTTERFRTEASLTVTPVDQAKLTEQLRGRSARLALPDATARLEAAEGLGFLESPQAVEYQARLLRAEGTGQMGVWALSRQKSPRARELLVGALEHEDSMVVADALAALDASGSPPPRSSVLGMLRSENDNVRWHGLSWLAKRPQKDDLASVEPLTKDRNDAVAKLAEKYVESLKSMK